VDDGTGVLGCRIFVEAEENEYQAERRMLCQKGAYVRVVGQVREYQVRACVVKARTKKRCSAGMVDDVMKPKRASGGGGAVQRGDD